MEYKSDVIFSDRLQKTNVGNSTLNIPIQEDKDNNEIMANDCSAIRKIAIFTAQSRS